LSTIGFWQTKHAEDTSVFNVVAELLCMVVAVFIGLDALEFPENSRRMPPKLPVGLQGQQVQYNAPGAGSGQV
jgi:hypothetical protein